jgi:Putative zinc-finger
MEKTMDCSDFRDDMMDVLYGEAPPETAERFATHVVACAGCQEEMASLRGVRQDLQAWGEPRPRARILPFLRVPAIRSMAAAAAIVIAFGGGLLSSRMVQVRPGEVVIRWQGGENTEVREQLAKVEAAHHAEIQAIRAQFASTQQGGGTPGAAGVDDTLSMRRVLELIHESEARQTALLQTSISQLGEHAEAQRRYDLAQIAAGLSYLESKTGADIARTNKAMNEALKVATPEPQPEGK